MVLSVPVQYDSSGLTHLDPTKVPLLVFRLVALFDNLTRLVSQLESHAGAGLVVADQVCVPGSKTRSTVLPPPRSNFLLRYSAAV
jgi:hypothetical protein